MKHLSTTNAPHGEAILPKAYAPRNREQRRAGGNPRLGKRETGRLTARKVRFLAEVRKVAGWISKRESEKDDTK